MSKRVVIACGSGIATSTLAVHKFQNFCDENGIDVQITQCSYGETDVSRFAQNVTELRAKRN